MKSVKEYILENVSKVDTNSNFFKIASKYLGDRKSLINKLNVLLEDLFKNVWSNEIHDIKSLQGMWKNIEDAKEDKGIASDMSLRAEDDDTVNDIYYRIWNCLDGNRATKEEILSEIGYTWIEEKVK